MSKRAPTYLIGLAALTIGMILFVLFGFQPIADCCLTKGEGFLWAGVSLLVTSVLIVGFLIDLVVFFIGSFFKVVEQ